MSSSKGTEKNHELLPERWIGALFAKLQARYGHRWTSAYPAGGVLACALEEWRQGLVGYSGEELARGLSSWMDDWPPSLPEFKKACRPPPVPLSHRDYVALPAPAGDPQVARESIERIRKILQRKEVE